ncbi:hypothetical protein TNCT_411481 [Trichonephila clavata]|uniref:Uncharacterized protein n=1 Tax=Trichonephila clavata TaxID=2740835 RepID=A0A8X6H659_TRICU|nr:hypothetical protein TNCT_411481 [Trichonephila clavata]
MERQFDKSDTIERQSILKTSPPLRVKILRFSPDLISISHEGFVMSLGHELVIRVEAMPAQVPNLDYLLSSPLCNVKTMILGYFHYK